MTSWLFEAQALFASNWLLAVVLFCILHFGSSALGIPGGCTALNILAGAVFGFPLACAIVYPITIFSAAAVYALGWKFSGKPLAERYQKIVARLSDRLGRGDFLFFVSLRLSPIFPFGLLNLACGWLRVPFGLFLTSTIVGIFFDVTLLCGLGAAAELGRTWLFAGFLILFGALWLVRSFLLKEKDRIRL